MKKRLLKICAASLAATLMMPALLFKDVSAATMGDVQDYIEAYTDYSELQGAYRVDDYILQAYVGYDESSAVFNLGAIIVEDEDIEIAISSLKTKDLDNELISYLKNNSPLSSWRVFLLLI